MGSRASGFNSDFKSPPFQERQYDDGTNGARRSATGGANRASGCHSGFHQPPFDEEQHDDAENEERGEEPQSETPHANDQRFSVREVAKRRTLAAKALGVQKDAGRRTVTRAFRQGAKNAHPDKGGDKARFQVLNEAYMK